MPARVRARGSFTSRPFRIFNDVKGAYTPKPGYPTVTDQVVGRTGTLQSMSDWVTPGYSRMKAQGGIFNSPMSIHSTYAAAYHGYAYTRQVRGTWTGAERGYQWAEYELSGDIMSGLLGTLAYSTVNEALSAYPTPFSKNSVMNNAIIQCLNRVEPAKSQSLVTALELGKSLDMITDRVRKLADVVQACKSRNVKRLEFMFPGKRTKRYPSRVVLWDHNGNPIIRKNGQPDRRYSHPPLVNRPPVLDDATKLWLEYRYGWSPLVYDIVDTLKAMYAADLRKELIPRTRKKASANERDAGQVVSSSNVSTGWGPLTEVTTVKHEYECRAYFLYEWSQLVPELRRLNDFGIFDVPRAIWEVTPWSFVIDWFIPIGDFLGALTPKVGVNCLASGYTTLHKINVSQKVTSFTSSPSGSDLSWTESPIPIGAERTVEYTAKERKVPLPNPTYPPTLVKLNKQRLVDAVALLRGQRSTALRI